MGTNYNNGVLGIDNSNLYNQNNVLGMNANQYNQNVLGVMDANNNSYGCNCNGSNNSCACQRDNENVLGANTTNNNLQENLRNFIGRRCTCEFCLGNNLIKRTGVLRCVGCNFLTLSSTNSCNCMLCNTDNLKFVTILN